MRKALRVCAVGSLLILLIGPPAFPAQPLWPGARFTREDKARAIERGVRAVYRLARQPRTFAAHGEDLLWWFGALATRVKDPALQRTTRGMAVELARRHRADVVLMDIRMPGVDGLEATRRIDADERLAGIKVLILTTFESDEYVYEALQAGASGFLVKDTEPDELVQAVRVVAGGDALLSPSVTRRLIGEFAARAKAPHDVGGLDELTGREQEVLALVADGLSNAEIAKSLVVSDTTVKTHVARILMKLSLRDRVQAVVLAYESGIVQPGAV